MVSWYFVSTSTVALRTNAVAKRRRQLDRGARWHYHHMSGGEDGVAGEESGLLSQIGKFTDGSWSNGGQLKSVRMVSFRMFQLFHDYSYRKADGVLLAKHEDGHFRLYRNPTNNIKL